MRIVQVTGYKNAGKTTLMAALIRELTGRGYRVGTIKHDAHGFDPDVPGTDSRRHREAGAAVTAITSPRRTAWFEEEEAGVEQLVAAMAGRGLDWLLIEGFKRAPYPKVALLRGADDVGLLALPHVIAAVAPTSDDLLQTAAAERSVPFFIHPNTRSYEPLFTYLLDAVQEPVDR